MLSQPLAKKVLNSPLSRPTVVDKKALKQKTAESVTVVPVVKEAVVQSEQKAHADSESDPAARTSQNTDEKVSTFLKWQKNGRPVWAQREFEVLMFEVSGLTLAVPLVALGQIVPLTDKLAPVFGQSDWFMGLLPSKLGDIRVVNTALLVMPEKYDPAFTSEAGYVITIDGHPWGLAVDCVKQALKLEPDAVKWRGERSKRAWLAGTVKTEMCVLIDIPQMAIQLDGADKNLHSN
ncbi:MAG: flagellar hook-basal body complex protein FliE [Alteromonadaceae bacterium]|nr:MAG: flagellar hook-basal body complex protein FliE [Alteromonadaceae bacterium]